MKEIIFDQLGHLTEDKFCAVPKAIKSRKAAGLNKISPEIWKTTKFDDATPCINKTQWRNEWKVASSPSLRNTTSESLRTTKP